jgi:hypothetical protein
MCKLEYRLYPSRNFETIDTFEKVIFKYKCILIFAQKNNIPKYSLYRNNGFNSANIIQKQICGSRNFVIILRLSLSFVASSDSSEEAINILINGCYFVPALGIKKAINQ